MKIIRIDNFAREGPGHDDRLICSGVSSHYGNKIVKSLNDDEHENSDDFYTLVEDDHKLQIFEP